MSDGERSARKSIPVANDDGIFSPGIKALALALADVGDVVVVAPDVEQSAVGHGITIRRPLRFRHTASAGFGEIAAYRVDGTPADCVVLSVHLLGRPDLVVSGINLGPNLGDDLTHSGTVAAAIEGLALGVPSIAFSGAARSASTASRRGRLTRPGWRARCWNGACRRACCSTSISRLPRRVACGSPGWASTAGRTPS